jgi:hypothetical protein
MSKVVLMRAPVVNIATTFLQFNAAVLKIRVARSPPEVEATRILEHRLGQQLVDFGVLQNDFSSLRTRGSDGDPHEEANEYEFQWAVHALSPLG